MSARVTCFRFDRTLGGLEFQLRLRDFLAEQFNKVKRTRKDVTDDARAMQKLFKEAGRVKQVLSANTDHFAQVALCVLSQSSMYISFCVDIGMCKQLLLLLLLL